jgi:uncharacterized protein (DUF1778 family)
MLTESNNEMAKIELQITKENKEALQKAASLTGLSLNDYIIQQALNAAMVDTQESYTEMVMSEPDWEVFMTVLDNHDL